MPLLTRAVVVEGAAFQWTRDLDLAHVVEAIITLVAFSVFVASVRIRDRRRARVDDDVDVTTPPRKKTNGLRSEGRAPGLAPTLK